MPKKGCSYGRKKSGKLQKNGTRRCNSKKEFHAKMKRASKHIGSKGTRVQKKLSTALQIDNWRKEALHW